MLQLRLGPKNLSAVGCTIAALVAEDVEYVASHDFIVDGVINEYDSADRYFIKTLFELIQIDKTAKRLVNNEQLLNQIRRATAKLIREYHDQVRISY